MAIYFDVGANDGSTSTRWAIDHPDNIVHAFEPNPYFQKPNQLANYIWHPVAVSNFTGKAIFNVCDAADRGCSSLLDLSASANTEWGGRTDMMPQSTIEVDVIRLDSIIRAFNIESIEYLHCDAQGSDLKVLQGMAGYLNMVKGGCVEVANKADILYVGQNHIDETIEYLKSFGFTILRQDSNDSQSNEMNVVFSR